MKFHTMRLVMMAAGLVSLSAWAEPTWAAPGYIFNRDNNTTFMTSFPRSLARFNSFTANMNSFGVDDIETAAGINPTLTFGATGITAATQGVIVQSAPGFQIGSQALIELDAVAPGQVNTMFTFNQYINAFGIYVIQGGDSANNNPTTFRLRDTADSSFVDVSVQVGPGWGLSNVFFIGIYDTTDFFDEVEIIETGDAVDGMLYDNVVAGFVPEPGSLALLMFGGICALGRRASNRRAGTC